MLCLPGFPGPLNDHVPFPLPDSRWMTRPQIHLLPALSLNQRPNIALPDLFPTTHVLSGKARCVEEGAIGSMYVCVFVRACVYVCKGLMQCPASRVPSSCGGRFCSGGEGSNSQHRKGRADGRKKRWRLELRANAKNRPQSDCNRDSTAVNGVGLLLAKRPSHSSEQ